MKMIKTLILSGFVAITPLSAMAAVTFIQAIPANWRLENYVKTNVVAVWYTPSNCPVGQLTLDTTNEAIKDRFWSVMLTAKAANRKVMVSYDNATTDCKVFSFGMEQ